MNISIEIAPWYLQSNYLKERAIHLCYNNVYECRKCVIKCHKGVRKVVKTLMVKVEEKTDNTVIIQ